MPPPVNSLSLPSNSLSSNVPSSHSLFARSLAPRSQPSRGFFGALFHAISRLTAAESFMRNTMSAWGILHSAHKRNTMIAQNEVNKEYLNYHNEEWEDKDRHATARTMKILAVETPYLFVRGYVLTKEEGSEERKIMTGILRAFNPEFYEKYQEVLGEAMDLNEMGVGSPTQDITDVDQREKNE